MTAEQPFITLERDVDLLAQTLLVEYRLIMHYPALLASLPDEESRKIVSLLGADSLRHADAVAQILRSMGQQPPFPVLDPLPDMSIRQVFERQLQYERLALALHTRAAEVTPPEHQEVLRRMAQDEEHHVRCVEMVLERVKA